MSTIERLTALANDTSATPAERELAAKHARRLTDAADWDNHVTTAQRNATQPNAWHGYGSTGQRLGCDCIDCRPR